MFTGRKQFIVALALSLPALGSPALAWSPLQYDSRKEVDDRPRAESVYKEIMDSRQSNAPPVELQPHAEIASPPPVQSAPAARPSARPSAPAQTAPSTASTEQLDPKAAEEAAVSAIEKDSASEPVPDTTGQESDEATPQIRPLRAAKPPGKMPNESIPDPEYFYKKALTYVDAHEYQSALNYVNRALTLSPWYWDAWYEKALIYQLSGYDAAAARRYMALLDRKPEMLPAHIALGTLYRKHGNTKLAEGEYQKAIDLNCNSFTAHYNVANLYMDENKLEQALKEYKVCLKLQPDNAQVHNNIGVIYQHRNYLEEAAAEFTTATHLDPANKTFFNNLENVKSKVGQKPSVNPL